MPTRRHGEALRPGWVVITVQCAHGLLHPDPARPPSPYAVVALDQQVEVTSVAPNTRCAPTRTRAFLLHADPHCGQRFAIA